MPGLQPPKIPNLIDCGRDLTDEARRGELSPVVGRTAEIDWIIDVLCRPTKRNPVIVGPAGVGKTAIVEGFAQRIVRGEVPSLLAGATLILLQPSLIIAGCGAKGELERKMDTLIKEASQDGVILFIDEIHTIVGAGGEQGLGDISSLMKPALARGKIACIGATTDDEYRRFFEQDSALERRFHRIPIQEMDAHLVFEVLSAHRDRFGVTVDDTILHKLIWYGEKYLRTRAFPDKAIDLLEQCVAVAVKNDASTVEAADADFAVQREIGMPSRIAERLELLRESFDKRCLLAPDDRAQLLTRLRVTLRGLDMRMERPNASILLLGDAATDARLLTEILSTVLYDTRKRIISIDLSRMSKFEDISLLLGAPPGYVGYSHALPLHRAIQHPWCVILFENLDSCHLGIQQVIGQALANGYFLDGQNRKIFLSDAILLFTAPEIRTTGAIGFRAGTDDNNLHSQSRQRLDGSIVSALDLISSSSTAENASPLCDNGIYDLMLKGLQEHFTPRGVCLTWDDSFRSWLETKQISRMTTSEWEEFVDRQITPAIDCCDHGFGFTDRAVSISCRKGRVEAMPAEN